MATTDTPSKQTAPSSAARLAVKSLVLENFKSYAGRQVIGPFHTSFTAVVGPNGSGKSNVMDGLLFAFGKQAKKLRLNKVSELIHTSEQYPDLPEATVTVTFHELAPVRTVTRSLSLCQNGAGGWEEVAGSEITLSRTARRDDKSEYRLNGKVTTREAVVTMLKSKGVDLDNNRFLILQGEVEQIAQLPPKGKGGDDTGLLEYLEDIIGSDRYVAAIQTAAELHEKYNEQRVEKLHRVKFVQQELATLKPSRDEAEAYLRREADGIDLQARVHLWQRYSTERKASECQTQHDRVTKLLAEQRAEADAFAAQHSSQEERHAAATAAVAALQVEVNETVTIFSTIEREDAQTRQAAKISKARVAKLGTDVTQLEATAKKKTAAAAAAAKGEEEAGSEVQRLEAAMATEEAKLEEIVQAALAQQQPLLRAIETVQEQLRPHQTRINTAQSEVTEAQSELESLVTRHEQESKKLSAAEADEAALRTTLDAKRQELGRVQEEAQSLKTRIATSTKERESLRESEQKRSSELRERRTRLEEAKMSMSSRTNASSAQKISASLLDMQRKGLVQGICGRLGDLGAVDRAEQLDTAFSTAVGGRFDSIVVETAEAAQKAVEILRQRQLGRATFIILDKLGAAAEATTLPANSQRLLDLVKCEARYRAAFYSVLRDTLLVPTLGEATSIALDKAKRWRVVTMKGELIDTTGAMSGGGQPQKGALARTVPAQEEVSMAAAADEEKSLVQTEAALAELRQRQEDLDQTVRDASHRLQALERDMAKLEVEVGQGATQLAELAGRIREMKQAVSSGKGKESEREYQRERKSLEERLADAEANLRTAQKAAEKEQQELGRLQKQLETAGGEKRQQQRKKVEAVSALLTGARQKMADHAAARKAAERSAEKATKDAEKAKAEQEAEAAKEAELREKVKENLKKAEDAAQQQAGLLARVEAAQKELSAAESDWSQARERMGRWKATELDLQHQIEDLAKRSKELAARLADLSSKMNTLARRKEALQLERLAPPAPSEDAMDLDAPPGALPQLSEEQLQQLNDKNVAQMQAEANAIHDELSGQRPNLAALEEYKEKSSSFAAAVSEHDAFAALCEQQRLAHEDLRRRRLEEFMAGFATINAHVAAMYKLITLEDGDADLQLLDSVDPFSEGLAFRVRPPKKSWKIISQLSGGEKTLASLSLVFALHAYKPTPLYILDEIDAALDFKNVSIIANLLRQRTQNAQFLVISLRNYMFEVADMLVGIYKTDNQTKTVAIEPAMFALPAGPKDS